MSAEFESALSANRFCIPLCAKCKKVVWPPSEFSSCCFGTITLKGEISSGKVIEFSEYEKSYFCLVEFEGRIRVMAKMPSEPEIGQKVSVARCGITCKGDYFFNVI